MTGFHPGVRGILYGALAQHEQALIQMALAANIAQADIDDEIADRYGAIVDGLKRLIAVTEPPSRLGVRSGIEAAAAMRRTYVLLGHLQTQLSDFDIWSWSCQANEIGANLCGDLSGNETVRANIRVVADRIGVDYVEKRHGGTGNMLIVCAKGTLDGVAVRIYDLIEAERPICDTHHVMVDAAGVCLECPEAAAAVSEYDPGDPDYEPGTEAGNCAGCEGWHRPPWCADLSQADDDGTHEGRFTNAQLDGTACSECGHDFTEGVAAVPTGLVIDGGQLFAHPDCLTDNTPTEPSGDAL